MSQIQVVVMRGFETAPGSPVEPGAVISIDSAIAHRWVVDGRCCYYADFSPSMLPDEVETRTVKPANRAKRVKDEE